MADDSAESTYRAYKRLRLLELTELEGVTLEPLPYEEFGEAFAYQNPERPDWPEIHLSRMLFNWRLQEVGIPGITYDRHWCYLGLSDTSFVGAVRALKDWQGNPDTEPTGWVKAWDGRRG